MTSEIETLRLPGDAERLLERFANTGDRLFGQGGWAIGGGSVLAARWRHRISTDIDVFVSREIFARTASGILAVGRELSPAPRRIDSTPLYVKYVFADGDIDIIGADPLLPRLDGEPVRSVSVRAEATAEILAKKIDGRGHLLHERDLYDFAIAQRLAPKALRCAMRAASVRSLSLMIRELELGIPSFGKEIREPRFPDALAGDALARLVRALKEVADELELDENPNDDPTP